MLDVCLFAGFWLLLVVYVCKRVFVLVGYFVLWLIVLYGTFLLDMFACVCGSTWFILVFVLFDLLLLLVDDCLLCMVVSFGFVYLILFLFVRLVIYFDFDCLGCIGD